MAKEPQKLPKPYRDKHIIQEYFSHQVCTERRPDRVSLVIQLSPDMVMAAAGLLLQASQFLDEEFTDFNAEMAQLYASTAYELRAAVAGGNMVITNDYSTNYPRPEIVPHPTLANNFILQIPQWLSRGSPPTPLETFQGEVQEHASGPDTLTITAVMQP